MMGFDSGPAIARIAAAERPGRVFATVMTNTETPGHVSLEELRIESYYPLDDATEQVCRGLAAEG